jgi:hypothetical protein
MKQTYFVNGSFQTAFVSHEYRNERVEAYSIKQVYYILFVTKLSKFKTLTQKDKAQLYKKIKTLKVSTSPFVYN